MRRFLLCYVCWAVVLAMVPLVAVSAVGTGEDATALTNMKPAPADWAGWADWIESAGARAPGQPGNRALEASVMQRFEDSGFVSGALQFDAPVFDPGKTVVEFADGTTHRVMPMHPTLMRPGNFDQDAFATRLVYLGTGKPAELDRMKGTTLKGAIAVMEFAGGDRWMDLLRFGLAGFIFLDAEAYSRVDAVAKVYNAETNVPRFFAAGDAAATLRARTTFGDGGVDVFVTSSPSRMRTETLRSPWVLVPGTDPDAARDVVLLTAPLDANSVVPELAYGGDTAGNLLLMLELLDQWQTEPPHCSVLLVAVNAHTQGYLGERMLAWHLLQDRTDISRLRDELALEMRRAEVIADYYHGLQLDPIELSEQELGDAMNILWGLAGDEPADAIDEYDASALRAAVDEAMDALTSRVRGFGGRMFMTDEMRQFEMASMRRLEQWREADIGYLRPLLREALPVFEDEQVLEYWRDAFDTSTGSRIIIKATLQDRIQRDLNVVKLDQMTQLRDGATTPEEDARLREERDSLTRLLILFNKIDFGFGRERIRYRRIAAHDQDRVRLRRIRDEIVDELDTRVHLFQRRLDMDSANGSIREALGTRRVKLAITLGMDWSLDRAGLMALNTISAEEWYRRLGDTLEAVAEEVQERSAGGSRPYVDALSSAVGLPQEAFFTHSTAPAQLYRAAAGVPSLALKPAHAMLRRSFTPGNRLSDLDPAAVQERLLWFADFLDTMAKTPGVTSSSVLPVLSVPGANRLWSCLVRTFEMDEFAAKPTPSLPVPHTILAAYTRGTPVPIIDGQVANVYGELGDATGYTILYGLPQSPLVPVAYRLDANQARVISTIDKGRVQQSRQIDSNLYRTQSKTLPMFAAAEFVLRDRRDPSILGSRPVHVNEVWVFSGESGSAPQKYGVHGANSLSPAYAVQASGPIGVYQDFRETRGIGEPLMIMTQNRRFAVNPDEEEPEGRGFLVEQELNPDFFLQVSTDMSQVIRHRLSGMTGIVNELVEDFLAQGQAALDAALAAQQQGDYRQVRRASAVALGNLAKAYGQIRDMNADMLQAIMIYMALMLPFCYFLQKLLFQFARIEHEMLTFAAFFIVTYTGFRFIHPAFAIAMSPEAIFLAFVLGSVGIFVVAMLHSRFSGEMDLLFRDASAFADEKTAAFVGQTAMIIGVNNMKRRRIRTTLTTATIVLVVFTMLAFSSVSRQARPSLILRATDSPYTGLLYTWPGGATMDEGSVRVIETLLGDNAEILIRRVLRPPHRWALERSEEEPRQAEVTALLSGSNREERFAGPLPLEYGRDFSNAHAPEIILPATLAEALDIGENAMGTTQVRLLGRDLTVVGILDDDRYRSMRDLDPRMPLLPMSVLGLEEEEAEQPDSYSTDTGAEIFFDMSSMAFLPSKLLQELGGAPYSVSVRLDDDAVAASDALLWNEADVLLRSTNASFILGAAAPFRVGDESRRTTEAGVYQVTGAYRTTIGGLSRLVVPLLIAGLLLFNTMLGTVYERKSEIAIYNAIGLNPRHIFVFFLAEALVYGVIGAIGGYLIGQILAMSAQSFGLVRGMNVNFSSLMVVWAIVFTVGLVLLSTLYPAWVATRTAVPSGTRRWSLPDHDGNHMKVDLPFIYEPELAVGVMAYLHEILSSCVEGAVSEMLVDVRSLTSSQEDGRPVLQSAYGVALAPYDLGVTQCLAIEARFDPRLDSYGMSLDIQRESGQDTSWLAVNQPMLERLRKALLRWRNMDPARYQDYTAAGRKLFEV